MELIPAGTKVGKYTVRRCANAQVSLGAVYEVEAHANGQTDVEEVNLLAPDTVLAHGNARYTVTRFLGGGGFGQAYLAIHDGRTVVAKRYIYGGDDPDYNRRALQREGRFLAALKHDGLPQVLAYFATDDQNAFVVMSLAPGRPLDAWVGDARSHNPDWCRDPEHAKRVLAWCLALAEILGVLHNLPEPLIHLDIKPPNVLVRDDGKVSLIDFGAARRVGPRPADHDSNKTVIGWTAGYVAPEYLLPPAGKLPEPTTLCDIYSFGVLMRVMLAGDDPEGAAEAAEASGSKRAPVFAALTPTGVTLWDRLAEVSAKACQFRAADRYQSAEELAAALLELTDDPARGRPDGLCQRCNRLTRRSAAFCRHCGRPAWGGAEAVSTAAPVAIAHGDADTTREFEILTLVGQERPADLARFRLYQQLQAAEQDSGFSELRCLDQIKVDKMPHQIEAARRALRDMGGFCLFADEVGLGKTIEAGIVLKELIVRDMARRVLIVAPQDVCAQWQQELYQRFGEYFVQFGRDVSTTLGWRCDRLIVPYAVTEDRTHWLAAVAQDYDLVIFDEAHHLLDRDSQRSEKLQRFARQLGQKARRLLMLSATPMLSELRDLHTLLTLLKPGSVGDYKQFRERYMDKSDPRKINNVEELRSKVDSVMIRYTRQRVPQMRFMTRDARRVPVPVPDGADASRFARFRGFVTRLCRRPDDADDDEGRAFYAAARNLAESYHSSAEAFGARCDEVLNEFAAEFRKAARRANVADAEGQLRTFRNDHSNRLVEGKVRAVCDILQRRRKYRGKFLVFTQYPETTRLLRDLIIVGTGMNVIRYPAPEEDGRGELGQEALTAFHDSGDVLVCGPNATEGLNLQVAHSLINYDLPPDPMKLEQRIGRIQRYGQKQPSVFVWNLYLENTYEEDWLVALEDILARISETVGEHEQIFGSLSRNAAAGGRDLADLMFDIILTDDADSTTSGYNRLDELLAAGEKEQTTGGSLMAGLVQDLPTAETAAAEAAALARFDVGLPGDDVLEKLGSNRARRRAPALAAALRCPVCSAAVNATDATCPTCSQPLQAAPGETGPDDDDGTAPVAAVAAVAEAADPEVPAVQCPRCQAVQEDPGECCTNCGETLVAESPAAEPQGDATTAVAVQCPRCQAVQEDPGECCTNCGETLAL